MSYHGACQCMARYRVGSLCPSLPRRGHLDFVGNTSWLQVWNVTKNSTKSTRAPLSPSSPPSPFPVGTIGNGTCGAVYLPGNCSTDPVGYFEGLHTLAACVTKIKACPLANFASWSSKDTVRPLKPRIMITLNC